MEHEPHAAAKSAAGRRTDGTEDLPLPELRALNLVINDKPNGAQRVIDDLSGKDRALYTYYLRELLLMIEAADATDHAARRRNT